jgi:DNA invertase Pin-like site-specific DNA recombinase
LHNGAFEHPTCRQIERCMISSRTKEALACKKSEGKRLGRPKGKLPATTKLVAGAKLSLSKLVS